MKFAVFSLLQRVYQYFVKRLLVKYVLTTHLGLDQLDFHLYKGRFRLTNLRFKVSAFNRMIEGVAPECPLEVETLQISEIVVEIPWRRLLLDSFAIKLKDVHISLAKKPVIREAPAPKPTRCRPINRPEEPDGIDSLANLVSHLMSQMHVSVENLEASLIDSQGVGPQIKLGKIWCFTPCRLETQTRSAIFSGITLGLLGDSTLGTRLLEIQPESEMDRCPNLTLNYSLNPEDQGSHVDVSLRVPAVHFRATLAEVEVLQEWLAQLLQKPQIIPASTPPKFTQFEALYMEYFPEVLDLLENSPGTTLLTPSSLASFHLRLQVDQLKGDFWQTPLVPLSLVSSDLNFHVVLSQREGQMASMTRKFNLTSGPIQFLGGPSKLPLGQLEECKPVNHVVHLHYDVCPSGQESSFLHVGRLNLNFNLKAANFWLEFLEGLSRFSTPHHEPEELELDVQPVLTLNSVPSMEILLAEGALLVDLSACANVVNRVAYQGHLTVCGVCWQNGQLTVGSLKGALNEDAEICVRQPMSVYEYEPPPQMTFEPEDWTLVGESPLAPQKPMHLMEPGSTEIGILVPEFEASFNSACLTELPLVVSLLTMGLRPFGGGGPPNSASLPLSAFKLQICLKDIRVKALDILDLSLFNTRLRMSAGRDSWHIGGLARNLQVHFQETLLVNTWYSPFESREDHQHAEGLDTFLGRHGQQTPLFRVEPAFFRNPPRFSRSVSQVGLADWLSWPDYDCCQFEYLIQTGTSKVAQVEASLTFNRLKLLNVWKYPDIGERLMAQKLDYQLDQKLVKQVLDTTFTVYMVNGQDLLVDLPAGPSSAQNWRLVGLIKDFNLRLGALTEKWGFTFESQKLALFATDCLRKIRSRKTDFFRTDSEVKPKNLVSRLGFAPIGQISGCRAVAHPSSVELTCQKAHFYGCADVLKLAQQVAQDLALEFTRLCPAGDPPNPGLSTLPTSSQHLSPRPTLVDDFVLIDPESPQIPAKLQRAESQARENVTAIFKSGIISVVHDHFEAEKPPDQLEGFCLKVQDFEVAIFGGFDFHGDDPLLPPRKVSSGYLAFKAARLQAHWRQSGLQLQAQEWDIRDGVRHSVYKYLCRYYKDDVNRPRGSHLPMFWGHLQETQDGWSLKLQILPLKLTLDQDTLVFLQEIAEHFFPVASLIPFHGEDSNTYELDLDVPAPSPVLPELGVSSTLKISSFQLSALLLACEYRAKRLDIQALKAGNWLELLNVLPVLEGLDINFSQIRLHQPLSPSELLDSISHQFTEDISRTQLIRSVRGFPPLKSVSNLASGFQDVFMEPLKQFQAKNGNVPVGVVTGLFSFLRHLTCESLLLMETTTCGVRAVLDRREIPETSSPSHPDLDDSWNYCEAGVNRFYNPQTPLEGVEHGMQSIGRGVYRAADYVMAEARKPRDPKEKAVNLSKGVVDPLLGAVDAVESTIRGMRIVVDRKRIEEASEKYKPPSSRKDFSW